MKKFIAIALCLMVYFSLNINKCYAFDNDDIYIQTETHIVQSNVSFDIIIRDGIPFYQNGELLYYQYNNIYYYLFFYDNYWYVRPYRNAWFIYNYRPLYFRPHRYDYKFKPGYHKGFDHQNVYYHYRNRPHIRRRDVMPQRSYPNRITGPSQDNINQNRRNDPRHQNKGRANGRR